jgi:hypothetical protein
MGLAPVVDFTEQCPATDTDKTPLRIHRHGVQGTEVDNEPVITRAVAGDAVPTAPNGKRQLALFSERNRCRHIAI